MPATTPALETPKKFVLDCTIPVNDSVIDDAAFEKFLHDRIKIDNKTNNLGDKVVISRASGVITITAHVHFAKRYFKYLTKKFLQKNRLRDWIRVLATRDGYTMKYYSINRPIENAQDEESEEEESEEEESEDESEDEE